MYGGSSLETLFFQRMSSLRTVFFAVFSLAFNALTAQDSQLDIQWRKAMALDSVGKHAQAVKAIEPFLQEKDWAYRARLARSNIYFQSLKRYQDAFTDVAVAMQLEPDSCSPYIQRSSFYMSAGMPDKAVYDLEKGLTLARTRSDSISMLVNSSAALGMMRQFKAALEMIDKGLELDPGNWGLLTNKAAHLDEMGRADEAKTIYLQLHVMRPDELAILNNLGFLTSRQGEQGEALEWFAKAQRVAPDDAVVLNNLGYAQLMNGRTDEALRNVQRSIKLNAANSYAYRNLGLIWKEKGERDKACTAFEQALTKGFSAQYGPEVENWRKEYCR
jgi:tetratricopeptide (TPR) repeat protein